MITFIEAALGAKAQAFTNHDEIVRHATIEIADATFEVDEASGEVQPNRSMPARQLVGRGVEEAEPSSSF